MKKSTILGLAVVAMLVGAPTASASRFGTMRSRPQPTVTVGSSPIVSAAYWTVHSEVLQSIVENFIIRILQNRDGEQGTTDAARTRQPEYRPSENTPKTPSRR